MYPCNLIQCINLNYHVYFNQLANILHIVYMQTTITAKTECRPLPLYSCGCPGQANQLTLKVMGCIDNQLKGHSPNYTPHQHNPITSYTSRCQGINRQRISQSYLLHQPIFHSISIFTTFHSNDIFAWNQRNDDLCNHIVALRTSCTMPNKIYFSPPKIVKLFTGQNISFLHHQV